MFPSFFTLFQAAESLVMQTKDAWIIHQVSHIQHRLEDHYLTINMILRPRNGGNGGKTRVTEWHVEPTSAIVIPA